MRVSKSKLVVVAVVVAGAIGWMAPAQAQTAPPTAASAALLNPETGATDQLIVYPASGSTVSTAALASDAGQDVAKVRQTGAGATVVKLDERLSSADVDALAAEWTNRADVALAEPDRIKTIDRTPNDPSYANQWDLKAPVVNGYGANLPGAWDVTTGSASVTVAVLDTGKLNHADLAGKFLAGYDFVNDSQVANDGNGRDSDPSDPGDWITSAENASGYFAGCGTSNSSWHGTHVSGTIGAATDNSLGVAGIAWGSKILPVRVLGKCGGYDSDITDAMKWSAGLAISGVPANPNPAQVVNLSLGGSGACSATWQNAINATTAAGTTVVVAAGNENVNASGATPANCSGVITVAATGQTGSRAYYSNYGTSVEIAAPGGDTSIGAGILSTLNNGTTVPTTDSYASYQGTSMATPHVAGVAALIKSVNPNATPAQVLSYLQSNITPFPAGSSCTTTLCGTGILNANAAVRAAGSAPGVPGTPTATAGNAAASVTWTAPSSTGGTPITGYTVTPYIGATAQTPRVFASTATTQAITGLTNNTAYTFTVSATNAIGTGTASAASNSVVPSAGAPPIADFDGNGKTDIAVFRPSNGGWFRNGGSTTYLGLNGDIPVPADYSDDGTADLAVFRPSNGAWFIGTNPTPTYLGLSGDRPVPGDYSGDGSADRAVWRPSTGAWYVQGQPVAYLGLSTDIPVPADYDGDGTTDIAVFRPSTGAWYVEGNAAQFFGANGDVPLPADYDGDGDVDRGVFRPSTGTWYLETVGTTSFGLSTDIPVPGQYDADAAIDIAVFRPSNGGWYVDGSPTTFFGLNGDIPAPRNPALT